MVTRCCQITTGVILVITLIIGILMLTAFPYGIYPALVKSQLKLSEDDYGQPTTITYYWSHLPANSYYNFYIWNVINPDRAFFFGDKVVVNDVGPYAFKEWESKEPTISDDKEHISYTNDKAWNYEQSQSCDICDYEDTVWQPNLSLMTTASLMLQASNLTSIQKFLTNFGTLLLGVYPYRQVKVKESLFIGYTDPLIDLINSPLVKIVEQVTGQSLFGFQTPDIQLLGFFPNYNHTGDENYIVNSGKSDYKKVAFIEKWANSTSLDWWLSDDANDVTGASDGSYWGGFLDKDKKLKNFQTFLCRHMEMEYSNDADIGGISGYLYKFSNGVFDTSLPENEGYTIKDPLDKIYFPKWANSHPLDSDGRHTFPAGMIEQKCFPGQKKLLPFLALLSSPHFYQAHPEVIDSLIGLSPKENLHNMGEFIIQPKVGSTLKASLRMQFNVAVFSDSHFITLQNLRSTVVPAFWLDVNINLKDYALNYIKFNTTTVPLIFLIVGIVLVVLSLLIGFTIIGSMIAKKQRKVNYLS